MSSQLSSANTFLTLLSEQDNSLRIVALERLQSLADNFWSEIANKLSLLEALYEDEKFPGRELTANLISKVYFHLEEYDDSLDYALKSGRFFNIEEKSQYVDCLVSKCIDKYVHESQENYEKTNQENLVVINPKLVEVVEKMMKKCISEGEYRQTIGIALESRRVDLVVEALERGNDVLSDLLNYLFDLAKNLIASSRFRTEIIKTIVNAFDKKVLQPNDYPVLCQCHFFLNQHEPVSKLLNELIHSDRQENLLLAYQIAYDISENENRSFINNIISTLPTIPKEDQEANSQLQHIETVLKANLIKILTGKLTEEIYLTYLYLNNQSDPQVILNLKDIIDVKNSVAHGAAVLANSLIQSGTINDTFLRENLDWVSKARNFSRFSIIASLGVVHKSNYQKAMELFKPYLPQGSATPDYPAHGGALFGLGLIHSNTKDQKVLTSLIDYIKNPAYNQNEQLIHGACLGIGLVGMGSGDETLYEELKNVLYTNSAVTGEAAGIAIGLVMAGTLNETVIQELITYAHETDHEKIIRAIAIANAMLVFGKEEQADVLIEETCKDKDSILRYGAMFMIGMAYIGTGNNIALKKLLHFASADVSDDVRRAAVISLSFLLINNQDQVPRIMNLLSMSYNPHVRYGTALALGISCAGTCNSEAIAMLEPMLKDTVDFVRQAAFIGTSMVLQQATEGFEPSVAKFRTHIQEIYSKKHEDILCKLGSILSLGILESGGRNSLITLSSQSGNIKQGACLGMLVFIQFWYWFPLTNFLSLSLAPSAFIGVNINLKIPKSFEFKCNSKPSMFDYPAKLKGKESNNKGKAETVKLSTTGKAKARAAKKGNEKSEMEIEDPNKKSPEADKKEEEEKKEEPLWHLLKNPSRVLEKQMKYISFVENRYKPLIKDRKRGLVFLVDSNPSGREEYFEIPDPNAKPPKPELIPPEEFIFDEESQKSTSK